MQQGLMTRRFVTGLALGLLGAFAPAGRAAAADKPVVVISTSMGDITVELEPEKAPKTVENFLKYVDDGHYTNSMFHRVISDFMIQGGGYDAGTKMERKTRAPIKNESLAFNKNGMSNERGTIAMARTGDPNSATAQFFINLEDKNAFLDTAGGAGYTAFGKVIGGMEVADKIRKVDTGTQVLTDDQGNKGPADDVPVKPVIIKSIKRKGK